MLKKALRLKSNDDFRRVFKNSRQVYAGRLAIRAAKSSKQEVTRVGFVVSNKIEKRATRRNALKRRLRALMAGLISEVEPGYDVVVLVKANYPFPYNSEEIGKELKRGLKELKLVK